MTALEELVEIEAIKKRRIQYSHYFDGQEVDALADLYSDDAVCEFGPDYGGDRVGKAQIRANFEQWSLGEGEPYSVLHAVTNPLIRLINDCRYTYDG